MKRIIVGIVAIGVLATPALAQIRPQNCVPVFPVVDQVAPVAAEDVIAPRAEPLAAHKRRFVGLGLLPFFLAGAGGIVILTHDHNDNSRSPV